MSPLIRLATFGRLRPLILTGVVLTLLVSGAILLWWNKSSNSSNSAPESSVPTTSSSLPKGEAATQPPASSPKKSDAATPTNPAAGAQQSQSSPSTPAPTTPPAAPATPPPSTPPTSAACANPLWSSAANYGTWSNNGYLVNNNIWNESEAGPQTLYACAWNSWYIISDQPGAGTDDSVKSYPDTQKHVNIPLSTMTTIPSTFHVSTPSGGGAVTPNTKQWNAAYDLWLDNFNTEVMVWTNWTANWQYWYGVYGGVNVTIDGVAYSAYYDGTEAMWFIRQNVTNNGSVDLAAILRWAVNQGWLQNTQVLHEIEYGFEVLYTGEPTRFDLINYTLTTN